MAWRNPSVLLSLIWKRTDKSLHVPKSNNPNKNQSLRKKQFKRVIKPAQRKQDTCKKYRKEGRIFAERGFLGIRDEISTK